MMQNIELEVLPVKRRSQQCLLGPLERLLLHTKLPLDVIQFNILPYFIESEEMVRKKKKDLLAEITWCTFAWESITWNLYNSGSYSVQNLLKVREIMQVCTISLSKKYLIWQARGSDMRVRSQGFSESQWQHLLLGINLAKPCIKKTEVRKKKCCGVWQWIKQCFANVEYRNEYRVNLANRTVTLLSIASL